MAIWQQFWISFGYQPSIKTPTGNNATMKPSTPQVNTPAPATSISIPAKPMMSYLIKPKNPSEKYSWLEKE